MCSARARARYTGDWKAGKRHGTGLLEYPSGCNYEGEFKWGRFDGRGTIHSPKVGFSFTSQ